MAGIEDLLRQAGDGALAATLSEVGRLPEDDRLIRSELTEENTARVIARMGVEGPTGREVAGWLGPQLAGLPTTDISWEIGRSALTDALGTAGPPITVEVSGNALEDLRHGADQIKRRLEALPQLWNVRSSFEGGPPELRITLDAAMADALGVNLQTMSRVLESSLDGRVATILSTGDEERRVTIRLPTPRREDLGDVEFRTAEGRLAAIGQVATFTEVAGAREVFRRDQRRTAEVTAQIAEGVSKPQAVAAVEAALDDLPLPPGARSALRGEEEQRARTFAELRLAGVLATGAGVHGARGHVRIPGPPGDRAQRHSARADRSGRRAGLDRPADRRHGDARTDRARGHRGERRRVADHHGPPADGGGK